MKKAERERSTNDMGLDANNCTNVEWTIDVEIGFVSRMGLPYLHHPQDGRD